MEETKTLRERRLEIARQLVEKVEFPRARGYRQAKNVAEVSLLEARYQRTMKLIMNPNHQNLYSMTLERKLMTETSLNSILDHISKATINRPTMKVLANEIRKRFKVFCQSQSNHFQNYFFASLSPLCVLVLLASSLWL